MATPLKRVLRKPATPDNFVAYSELTDEDRRFFDTAHLHLYLQDPYKRLFPKSDGLKRPAARAYQAPSLSGAELDHINTRIKYALELIGQHSNARFGKTSAEQHAFFQRQAEQEVFFIHLFRAIQLHKKNTVSGSNAETENIPIFNDGHLEIEVLRDKKKIFPKIGKSPLTENEIYAAGIFYAINFVFAAVKMNDAARVSRLLANMFHFGRGTAYEAAHGKKGGKENIRQWEAKKERAYALFVSHDIYNKYNRKHAAMLAAFKPILRRNSIRVSPDTLKTKWLPEFVKRLESNP